jgi:hypothetical protein
MRRREFIAGFGSVAAGGAGAHASARAARSLFGTSATICAYSFHGGCVLNRARKNFTSAAISASDS